MLPAKATLSWNPPACSGQKICFTIYARRAPEPTNLQTGLSFPETNATAAPRSTLACSGSVSLMRGPDSLHLQRAKSFVFTPTNALSDYFESHVCASFNHFTIASSLPPLLHTKATWNLSAHS